MKRKIVMVGGCLLILAGLLVRSLATPHTPGSKAHADGSGDWPMYMGDIARSGMNPNEATVTAATASSLTLWWKFKTGGQVNASPTIVGGVMYIGSWDGYEYAIDTTTQTVVWKQYLGVTVQGKSCYAPSVGVYASATVQNNVVYVAGGDGNLYALNTTDGSVIWSTLLGAPPYYNWSSPLVYNNKIYIGLAAFCDPPSVQGKILAFNSADGSLAASLALVPNGRTGAPIWSSLAVDASTNTLYATTGDSGSLTPAQTPNSEAILALNADTLAIQDRWQIPKSDRVGDGDFGATPTLFDANGVHYVGALNKNGIYYVFDRTNLAAGPVWKQALSGTPLKQGDNVSPSCFSNGTLYVSAGRISGTTIFGSIHAFDAATGTQLWSATTNGAIVAPVTCTNDLLVDGQGKWVEVRSALTGTILFTYATGYRVQGASVILNGVLYTPSADRCIYAFKIP